VLSATPDLSTEGQARRESPWLVPGEVVVLLALAFLTWLPALNAPPFTDELTHVFAARSLLARGVPEVVPGALYVRGLPFTYLVAGSYALLGEGLAAARVPSFLAGAGLVVAVFLWVRGKGGRVAGWTAALLLCFTPVMIEFSCMARFYTLFALVFWIGAVLVYRIATAGGIDRGTLLCAVGVGACLELARRLHVTTPIAIATIGLWLVLIRGGAALRLIRRHQAARIVALVLLVVACGFIAFGLRSAQLRGYLQLFRYADLWAADEVGNHYYYVQYLAGDWPTIWALFPVLTVVALWYRPLPASLCVVVFCAALAIHSLAAWKNIRYLFYALPMYCAVVGFAAAAILPRLHRAFTELLRTRVAVLGDRPRWAATLSLLGLAAAGIFAGLHNPAIDRARADRESGTDGTGWRAARTLAPLVDSSAVFVASSGLEALYFFNRVDYGLLATDMTRIGGEKAEFTASNVFGRPMVSTAQSLGRIMVCYPTGLVLVEKAHWRKRWAVTEEAATFLIQHADSLPLPRAWRMIGFRWRHPIATPSPDCPPERAPAEAR
jgi:hypothetical protein